MDSEYLSQLAKEIVRELENGAGLDHRTEGCYTFLDEIEPDESGRIGVDGYINLFWLIRRLHWGVPHPATELPDEPGKWVLLQFGSPGRLMLSRYLEVGPDGLGGGGWQSRSGAVVTHPQCWWDLPAVLHPEAVAELTAEPEPSLEPEELSSGEMPFPGGECPKCGYDSGSDWFQCQGSCPIHGSPHYNAAEALRRILRPARKS